MSAELRCYTVPQLLESLQLTKRTFRRLRAAGKLPFLEEIQPRLGRSVRYRADLVDRYLAGQWGQSRFFRRHA
jgi:excisionase family DNA binding protein